MSERSRDDLAAERRAAILRAAEHLVAQHGFDALRLRDVSQGAGVSIGLIQHYFTTRDELLDETMRTASMHRVAQWAQLTRGHDDASAKLAALLEGSIKDRHRCVVWLETCAAATRHPSLLPDVQRTQDAWRQALQEVIDEGVAVGDFNPLIPVGDVVTLLVSLIDGLMLGAATELSGQGREEKPVRLLREAAERLLRTHQTASTSSS